MVLEESSMENIIQGLNQLKRAKYPGDESLFIFTTQFLPVKEKSFKIFQRAELVLWLVRKTAEGNKKKMVLTISDVDRYADPASKDFLKKELDNKFILLLMDWLFSGGLQKEMENGTE